jgi:hypothetical protein
MAFAIGRPSIAADVADACALPRGAGFLVSLFFTVTIQKYFRLQFRFIKSAGMYQRKINKPLKSSKKLAQEIICS